MTLPRAARSGPRLRESRGGINNRRQGPPEVSHPSLDGTCRSARSLPLTIEVRQMSLRKSSFALLLAATLAAPLPLMAASLPPVEATHGMVVTAQSLASAVGVEILKKGGNAVDAAVAVVHPCCGNLGGGGFMLIHLASGKDVVLDFRETAPLAAARDMYLDAAGNVIPDASTRG